MPKWTYKFEIQGGYDCMSSAFDIYRDGILIATIDQHDFGEENFTYELIPAAKQMAEFIVNACNEKEGD